MKVIVVGAYGFTGKLVCKQLDAENIPFDIAGRNVEELNLLKNKYMHINSILVVDITSDDGVEKICDSDLIINCIGPFGVFADKLLDKIVESGKIYFDISGEEVFVSNSIEKYYYKAKSTKAMIVHAAAFESALVDVSANLLLKEYPDITTLKSYYRFEKSKPSPGTRFTMKLSKYRKAFVIENGEKISIDKRNIKNEASVKIRDDIYYPMHYPMPEVPLLNYKLGLENISSYLLTDEMSASLSKAQITEDNIENVIERFKKRKVKGPTEEQRAVQYFDLIVRVFDKQKQMHEVILSGTDMYLVTAKVISYLVKKQLRSMNKLSGIVTPYELLDGEINEFFNYLGVDFNK